MRAGRISPNETCHMAPGLPGLGVIEHGMIAERNGHILYAGPAQNFEADEIIDCEGCSMATCRRNSTRDPLNAIQN